MDPLKNAAGPSVPLESALYTEELRRRPSRPADHEAENRALVEIAQVVADSPITILQQMAEIILKTFRADSVVFSLLDPGGERSSWPAIAGVWKRHIGGGTPRELGPCGDVLAHDRALILSHPEHSYPSLLPYSPPIVECLLVPFRVGGNAIGTIWLIFHDNRRRFDAEDHRMIRSLGAFAATVYEAKVSIASFARVNEDLEAGIRDHALLERAGALLASVVESSEDAIITKTLDGIIDSWNSGAERLFGYSSADAVGRSITIIIPPDRLDEERTILRRLRDGERIDHFETVRITKRGRLIDISLSVSPLRDKTGKIIGASKIARDITDRKRAVEALKEADRRKNEFLAMLAHELRNPLAAISNAVELLRRSGHDEQKVKPATDMLHRQSAHMVRLVNDLLDVSRISTGKVELCREPVELASVVNLAVESVRPLCESMDHELTVVLPARPLYLDADGSRLAQVVGNLLNNACKFTERGGSSRLTVEREGGQAVIRVQDNGIGIAAEKLGHIFDMFTQIDTSYARLRGGLGVGLTLVKTLVEMHGGTIEARSAGVGHGSEFIVRLSIPSESAPPSPKARTDVAPVTVRRRILVVDDNRDSAVSLAMLLRLGGHEVHIAHDGLEAVEAAAKLRPDVILLDIGLPKLDGYEAARRIREHLTDDGLKLVALTGWGQEEDRRRSEEAGFDAHLVKPVDLGALSKLLA